MADWYYQTPDNRSIGPLSVELVRQCVESGTINNRTLVISTDGGDWLPASNYPWIFANTAAPTAASGFGLSPCRGCGRMVHYTATTCPQCGARIYKPAANGDGNAAKIAAVIFIVLGLGFWWMLGGGELVVWASMWAIIGGVMSGVVAALLKRDPVVGLLVGALFGPVLGPLLCFGLNKVEY